MGDPLRVRAQLQGACLATGWVIRYVYVLSYRDRAQLQCGCSFSCASSATGCVLSYCIGCVFCYKVCAWLQGGCSATGCVLGYRVNASLQGAGGPLRVRAYSYRVSAPLLSVRLVTGCVLSYLCVLSYRVGAQLHGACSVTGCVLNYRVRAQLLYAARVSLQGVCLVRGCVLNY